jgi:hypothetical protein
MQQAMSKRFTRTSSKKSARSKTTKWGLPEMEGLFETGAQAMEELSRRSNSPGFHDKSGV